MQPGAVGGNDCETIVNDCKRGFEDGEAIRRQRAAVGTFEQGIEANYKIDAFEHGLGVSEYMPGAVGDREMRRLLAAVLAETRRQRGV